MILVLCHGAICRSPFAVAMMKKAGLEDVMAAGFKQDGALKTPKKVRDWASENQDIDLSDHRSQHVTKEMLEQAEWILYMDAGQRRRLEMLWDDFGLTQSRGQLGNFCEPLARYLDDPKEKIGDPMFAGGKEDPRFVEIMNQLVEASTNFVKARAESPIVADVA